MRILFLHQNFPGQFVHIARALLQDGRHELLALVPDTHRLPTPVPLRHYAFTRPAAPTTSSLSDHYDRCVAQGAAVAAGLRALDAEGFVPDLVIGHGGWGETLFVKDVWPKTRFILYAEFCYAADGADVGFDPEFPLRDRVTSRMRVSARNTPMLHSLLAADLAVCPTRWQADSFPAIFQPKIVIAHEGIDTARAHPDADANLSLGRQDITLRVGDEVVTFIARNLEPYRGYHVLMRALPRILAARPNARIVIVGGDGVSYGSPPADGSNWKTRFLSEVAANIDISRIHFVGRVPHSALLQIMRVSAAHIYLTYPFVLSWSLLEAMSAGALIIGSRTAPVEEVVTHGENGLLCEFFDIENLAATVIEALSQPQRYRALRKAARETIVRRFDLERVCLPLWRGLVDGRREPSSLKADRDLTRIASA
jgi:glycosyltransferase involved in cell wall biosynthesis